jgi:hypothetical protein
VVRIEHGVGEVVAVAGPWLDVRWEDGDVRTYNEAELAPIRAEEVNA